MNRDVLCRPFAPEQLKHRKGQGGKQLSYVDVAAVIARLNEGSDVWSFEILKYEVLAEEVFVLGKLTVDGVAKMSFGGSNITRDSSGAEVSVADDLKAAGSDALKKTASLFGIGLELYGGAPAAPRPRSQPEATAPVPDELLSPRQLAAIGAACRKRGWSHDALVALVSQRFKKHNAQALTRSEASSLLSELTGTNGDGH